MFGSALIALSLVLAQPGPQSSAKKGARRIPNAAAAPIITLYTMGRGDLMVEKFGHAALCVKYRAGINELDKMCSFPSKVPPKGIVKATRRLWIRLVQWPKFEAEIKSIDPAWTSAAFCIWRHAVAKRNPRQSVCYNYGTTDFSDPIGLGWGFLRGRSKFWVAPQFFSTLYRVYVAKDRSMWRQVLPLTPAKAWATARKLEHDVLDENKYYNYHHFYDNCTTRVRDIVDFAVDGKLKVGTDKRMDMSFRDYAAKGFAVYTWILATSDFFAGRGSDVKPTVWQAMFLPRIMRDVVTRRVGVKPVQVYKRKGAAFPYDEGNMGRLWTLLFAVLISSVLIASVIWGRFRRTGLWIATVALTLIAVLLWLLASVSTLYELRVNEACLLFWPVDGALPFLSDRRRINYARIRVAGLMFVSLLVAVGWFKQPLWMPILVAFIPLFTVSRLWELVPQVAARAEQRRAEPNGKEVQDAPDAAPNKRSPNLAAMRSKKPKKSKKRKR